LEGLHIGLVGDLKHGRTVHSLALALSHFNTRIYCISPPHLALPDYICQQLKKSGVRFSFHPEIQDVIGKMDILYMTRQQKERHDAIDRMMTKDLCVLNVDLLAKAKKNLKILHPLPRLSELPNAVDLSPHAYYFTQAENGVYVRQSLLAVLLQRTP
jgi:aspartate carbamoyltransferase catalytic subunit